MKRRILSVLLAAAVIGTMTAGCGAGTQETEQTTDKAAETVGTEATAPAETAGSEAGSDETEAAGSEAASDAADEDTFTVGFDQNFPPMGFVGEDGEFTGFDLEVAAEAASRMGKTIKYQPIAWDAKDMELETGAIDCIWNGFTMNGREEGYTWTTPYMKNSQVFVVRADSGIAAKADLAGKVVDVQVDSSAEAALNDDPDLTASFGQLISVADYNTAFMDLEAGAVDAIAMDDVVASYQIEQRSADFVVLEEVLSEEEYGVGFKKGNDAGRDELQAVLDEMAADGKMAEISAKWFGKDITTIAN